MAQLIIPARGCVYVIGNQSNADKGFYSLDPALRGDTNTPILLEGADGLDGDIVSPVVTLEDKKILYVFGEDFGNITISGMVLLGKVDRGGNMFQAVTEYFGKNRVGVRKTPVSLSYPGQVAQKIHLNSLVLARPDPEFHIQVFQFRAVSVGPPGGDGS